MNISADTVSRIRHFYNSDKGDQVECNVVILASGYCFDFSFLPDDAVSIHGCQKKVNNIYHQILHVNYPTLGFIGIPSLIVPFPLIDCQGEIFALSYF